MKRGLAWLLGLLVLVGAGTVGLAWLQPDRFRVERSIDIDAAPGEVFPFVEDFTQWVKWSPWEHVDPKLQRLFGNPFRGMGASYVWSGNAQAGEVRLLMRTARLANGVFIDAAIKRPWRGDNQMVFKFDPTSTGTRLTWSLAGPLSFGDRLGSLFRGREARLGPAFETGLANLKRTAEAERPARRDTPAAAPAATPAS